MYVERNTLAAYYLIFSSIPILINPKTSANKDEIRYSRRSRIGKLGSFIVFINSN